MVDGFLAGDALDDPFDDRESLQITVVVDCHFVVSLKMIVVHHVDILQIDCCGFIGNVQRVLQRNIPDRESLEFRIAGHAPLTAFVVQLVQAGSQLAAAGTRSGNDDNRLGRRNISVLAEALFADDLFDIGRITFDGAMGIDFDVAFFEFVDEHFSGRLSVIARDDDTVDG